MVPKDFRKQQCVTAGWVTLLVAVVWEIASIYSVGVFNCAWNFFGIENGISIWNMLYITYLMGGCKSESDALSIGFVLIPPTTPAKNLQIWLWIFCVVTLAWILSCVTLIVAASSEVRGKAGATLYYPWLCVTVVLVILDLAGAVYHFVDVFSTTTPDDYASFTDNTNWNNLTLSSSSEGLTTWLPSLYITLFFCRFLVLWLLNIYFVYVVYKASSAVAVYNTKYLQSTLMTAEKSKTWKDRFFKGPEPRELPLQSVSSIFMPPIDENRDFRQETQERSPPARSTAFSHSEMQRAKRLSGSSLSSSESTLEHYPVRYEVDEFGIPIKELYGRDPREISYNPNEGHLPRSPLPSTSQVFDYPELPSSRTQSSSERWQESAPPLAGGVEVPPELNKNRPFSYMAGDQPQFMKKPLSRTNSRAEYPMIPRPDYTVAKRHLSSGSLEYVPHRFKIPSPKRPLQSTSSFNYDSPSTSTHSPTSPRRAPITPSKKPQFFPKVSKPPSEDISTLPQAKYIHQQDIPSQQQTYHTSKPSQSTSDYNIHKLY